MKQGWQPIARTMSDRLIVAGAPAFRGIALLDPAWDAFIEYPQITIAFGIELFVGQTGQLVGAGSVEDHYPVARDFPGPDIDTVNGNRQRAFNMPDQILLAAPHVDEHYLRAIAE